MDWLTFLLGLVKALIWPGVVVFAVVLFRTQAILLLSHFGKRRLTAKGGGVELTVSEELDKIEDAQTPAGIIDPATVDRPETTSSLETVAPVPVLSDASESSIDTSWPPDYIISRAWNRLLDSLKVAAYTKDPEGAGGRLTAGSAMDFALNGDFLPVEDKLALTELRSLRNEIVHGASNDLSTTEALRYNDLATKLTEKILLQTRRN